MRTYANNSAFYPNGKRAKTSTTERASRDSNEWDVRIDCDAGGADDIINNIEKNLGLIDYAMVSGIEEPDSTKIDYGSKNHHVHIAFISKYPLLRHQVLTILRGHLKLSDEYCCPRNPKFTYAGWYLHHSKWGWKIPNEPSIRYQYGTLPEDPLDDETKMKIVRMYNKFGAEDRREAAQHREKFSKWLDPTSLTSPTEVTAFMALSQLKQE